MQDYSMALKFLSLTLTVFQNIILQHQACDCEIVPCELMETAILWTQSQYNHMSGEFANYKSFFSLVAGVNTCLG